MSLEVDADGGKESRSESFKAELLVQDVQPSARVEERIAIDVDAVVDDDYGGKFSAFPSAKKDAGVERVADISGTFPLNYITLEQQNARVASVENPTNQQQLLHPLLMESLPVHLQQQLMPHLEAIMTNLQQHQQNTPYESYLHNSHNDVTRLTSPYQQNYIDLQGYTNEGLNGYTTLPPPLEFMGPPTRPFSPSSTLTPMQSLEGESWLSFDPHSESPSSLSSFKPYMFDLTEQDVNQQSLYLYRQYFLEQQQQQYREMVQRRANGNGKPSSPIDSLLSIDSIQPFSVRSSPLELQGTIPPPPVPTSPFQCQAKTPLILPPPSPFSEPPFLGADQSESFPPPVQFCGYPGDVYSNSDGHQTIYHPVALHSNYAINNGVSFAQDFSIAPAFPGELQVGEGKCDTGYHQAISGLSEQSLLPGHYTSFYYPQEIDFRTPEAIVQNRSISRTSSTTPKFVPDFHPANSDDLMREMLPLPLPEMSFHDATEGNPLCLSEIEITLDSESEVSQDDGRDEINYDSNQVTLSISDQTSSKEVSTPTQVFSEAYFDLEQCSSSSTETLNFESKTLAPKTSCSKNISNKEPQNNYLISTNANTPGTPAFQGTEFTSEQPTANPKDFIFESKWSSDLFSDTFSSSVTLTENSPSESNFPAVARTIVNPGLPDNSEQKQNLNSPFQKSIQDAQNNLKLESPNKPESHTGLQVTSLSLPSSEQETSSSFRANAPLWHPSSTVLHTCPHCHYSLPSFDAALPYWSSGLGFKSSSDQENQTGNVQPPPAPPLPADLLTPSGSKLKLTRRRSLQPGDTMLPDPISGLLTKGAPGRTPWSYVPDKKVIEEQSQRIRQRSA